MSGMNCSFENARWNVPTLTGGAVFFGQNKWWSFDAPVRTLARLPDMTEQSYKPTPIDAQPTASGDASAADEAKSAQPEFRPMSQESRKATRKRKFLAGAVAVAVLAVLLVFGIPWVEEMLSTVSTDDAFVNGHVTFVAPRVAGQISRVLVDDNNRMHKGDLLAELDKEPYRVAVSEKQAAVDTANTDLQAAIARVRGIEVQARSQRWNLQHAVQKADDQIALLHARVADLEKSKAALVLAKPEFERAKQLVVKDDVSREVYDQRQAGLTTANAGVVEALAEVSQIRVSLGLPPQPGNGEDLGHVPSDLDETFSDVLQAQADLIQSAALLGVVHSYEESPKEMIAQFEKLGDIDRTFAQLTAEAPPVKQAEAKLEAAKRDLDEAELNLRYCDIVADIDGVVTRRNVNPGNFVQVGQNLMAVRSLKEIWVDANFKETQLRDLRIGQPVDLRVDMYSGTHIFKGRVSGFTMGTGSTLALLPPENATGNFVKVVQRLPVRIDLVDYDADQTPLFIGTSVVPDVYIKKPPTGPDAGKFLQAPMPRSPSPGRAVSASGIRQ
jgi:membrane fusion protein (multidrug efflux system)